MVFSGGSARRGAVALSASGLLRFVLRCGRSNYFFDGLISRGGAGLWGGLVEELLDFFGDEGGVCGFGGGDGHLEADDGWVDGWAVSIEAGFEGGGGGEGLGAGEAVGFDGDGFGCSGGEPGWDEGEEVGFFVVGDGGLAAFAEGGEEFEAFFGVGGGEDGDFDVDAAGAFEVDFDEVGS